MHYRGHTPLYLKYNAATLWFKSELQRLINYQSCDCNFKVLSFKRIE